VILADAVYSGKAIFKLGGILPQMSSINRFTKAISQTKPVVVGDFLLDCYEFGQVNRVSPEAPVPVFSFERREFRPGGAGNVIQNLYTLGLNSDCVGFVGNDVEGEHLTHYLSKELHANIEALVRSQHRPTPLKTRLIARNQQVVRIDREQPEPLSDNERSIFHACLKTVIPESTHVFVSDYGQGVVELGTVNLIRQCQPKGWIAVDPRGKSFEKYRGCSLITPNQQEAEFATGMTIRSEADVSHCLNQLYDITQAPFICMTRHEHGMTLLDAENHEITHQAAWSKRDVFDVTGAGDTVLVYLSLALSFGLPVQDAMALASAAAYLVIQKLGASAVTLDELRHLLSMTVSQTKQL
jgi:rfaE bifunctional protein kinase chain/domain